MLRSTWMIDSTSDTKEHIIKVRTNLNQVVYKLIERAIIHDRTKFVEPEKGAFDTLVAYATKYGEARYGSPEYFSRLDTLNEALSHHYQNNPHHPEFHKNGIRDMSLVDLIEMLADWKAAAERYPTSSNNVRESLRVNRKRFNIPMELVDVLNNTINDFDW